MNSIVPSPLLPTINEEERERELFLLLLLGLFPILADSQFFLFLVIFSNDFFSLVT